MAEEAGDRRADLPIAGLGDELWQPRIQRSADPRVFTVDGVHRFTSGVHLSPPIGEELRQQRRTLVRQHPAADLHPMRQPAIPQQIPQ